VPGDSLAQLLARDGAFSEAALWGVLVDAADVLFGQRVADPSDVATAIEGHQPGDDVDVEVVRSDGTRETLVVHLGRRPAKTP